MMRALLWEVYKLEQRGGNAWTSGRAVPFSRHLWWNVGEDSQASGGRAGGRACGDARASQGNGEDLVGLTSPPLPQLRGPSSPVCQCICLQLQLGLRGPNQK